MVPIVHALVFVGTIKQLVQCKRLARVILDTSSFVQAANTVTTCTQEHWLPLSAERVKKTLIFLFYVDGTNISTCVYSLTNQGS